MVQPNALLTSIDLLDTLKQTDWSVCFGGLMLTKSEATVASILDTAATLFVAKGYADVTMSDIARAATLTKGAIYHHFDSKEELYLAMLHRDLARKRDLFETASGSEGSCRERLARLTRAFHELPRETRRLTRLVRRDIHSFKDPSRDELVRAYQACLPEQVEEILKDGILRGELKLADPRLLSWHYVAMVEVVLSDYADRTLASVDEKLESVLDLFLNGASDTGSGGSR